MPASPKVLVGLAILMGVVSSVRMAHAEDVESLIRKGNELRQASKALEAHDYFVRAYRLERTPRTAAQLGLCEFDLRQWVDADAHLDEALSSTENTWLNQHRSVLSESLAEVRSHFGTIEVAGEPSGAEVTIAGASVGRLPLASPIRVVEGPARVSITADGYKPDHRTVSVVGRKNLRLDVKLASETRAVTAKQPAIETESPRLPSSESTWMRPAAWVAAGAGVALMGGGLAALLVSRSRYVSFNNATDATNTIDNRCNDQAPAAGGGSCTGLLSDAKLYRNLAVGGFILGGAVAAVSAVLFVKSGDSTDGSRSAIDCYPIAKTWGGACRLTF